ncbi:MAG: cytochrome c2, partial [Algoriphagus sp.]
MNFRFAYTPLLVLIFAACSSKEEKIFGEEISTSSEQILAGRKLFEQNCSTCHNFNENAIGPNLSGLTRQVETDWIKRFIK